MVGHVVTMREMIIIASHNGAIGMDAAMNVLKSGGSALDAVETGIRLVEANPEDHSVGYNGYPNILGELELDASIMDGRTLDSGAVALLRGLPLRHLGGAAGHGASTATRLAGGRGRGTLRARDQRRSLGPDAHGLCHRHLAQGPGATSPG